ncbi:hypothetical protein TWF281_003031 [Arthrobotrys megalospora]
MTQTLDKADPRALRLDRASKLSASEHPPPGVPGVTSRFFAVQASEGLEKRLGPWTQLNQDLWPRFLQAHFDDSEDLQRELEQENTNVLFLNWERLVSQSEDLYQMGKRILAGNPYGLHTVQDPKDLKLDHESCLSYDHAAKERMPLISEDIRGVFASVLLLDPTRHHCIMDIKFKFWNNDFQSSERWVPCFLESSAEMSLALGKQPLERFISILKEHEGKPTMRDPRIYNVVEKAFIQLVCEDLARILRKISSTLCTIELALHDDLVLRNLCPHGEAN